MNTREPKALLSGSEIRAYIAYAAIDVLIAIGMFAVAPKGLGQVLGVAFALALLPLPAVVLRITRRRKAAKEL